MSSRPVQRILSPVLSFLFGPLLRPHARQLVTRAATPLLHKPSSTGVQPSPMSILRLWMSLLRSQTERTRESDASRPPFLAVGVYEMPDWGRSSTIDIAFFGQIREPIGMTIDVVDIKRWKFFRRNGLEIQNTFERRVHLRRSPPKSSSLPTSDPFLLRQLMQLQSRKPLQP